MTHPEHTPNKPMAYGTADRTSGSGGAAGSGSPTHRHAPTGQTGPEGYGNAANHGDSVGRGDSAAYGNAPHYDGTAGSSNATSYGDAPHYGNTAGSSNATGYNNATGPGSPTHGNGFPSDATDPPYAGHVSGHGPYGAAAQPHGAQPFHPQHTALHPASLPLMRPKHGRWLCGVCRGISLHLGVSVVAVRLLMLSSTLIFGAGVVVYLFLWLFMPVGDPVAAAQRIPVNQAPLSRGNRNTMPHDDAHGAMAAESDGEYANGSESLFESLKRAPKPALVAAIGLALIVVSVALSASGVSAVTVWSAVLALCGLGIAWSRFNAKDGQLPSMIGGIALLFLAFVLYVSEANSTAWMSPGHPGRFIGAGLALLIGAIFAVVPWMTTMVRELATERALKEREEERADMTAHLHDGVLQTLALIQLHADDQHTVFSLARQQERELREWLYQERTPSDRSVSSGLRQIAAAVEDEHGKPIEVITVGDARPSAQTDALLDATRQALVNAVTHGGEPISVYCEAGEDTVEVFVRDHGNGFDIHTIPEDRLGIRESIVGRVRRRGGTVEIVSRPDWGTEVRMHMPIRGTQPDHGAPAGHSAPTGHGTPTERSTSTGHSVPTGHSAQADQTQQPEPGKPTPHDQHATHPDGTVHPDDNTSRPNNTAPSADTTHPDGNATQPNDAAPSDNTMHSDNAARPSNTTEIR